jgi:hypothetical protein
VPPILMSLQATGSQTMPLPPPVNTQDEAAPSPSRVHVPVLPELAALGS